MIINSPVGRFPFTVSSVRLSRTGFIVEGAMGTWPTRVEGTASDVPRAARRLSPGIVALAAAAVLVLLGAGVVIGLLLG